MTALAAPLHKIATKSFEKMSDPDKITIQRLFVHYWDAFLKDPQVIKNGVRLVVLQEVERMMSCGIKLAKIRAEFISYAVLEFLIVMSYLPLTKDYADSSRKIVCYSWHHLDSSYIWKRPQIESSYSLFPLKEAWMKIVITKSSIMKRYENHS